MKDLSLYDVLEIILNDKETCTFTDLHNWKHKFNIKNPYVYVDITRDAIYTLPKKIYYFDFSDNIFYKQIELKCPICGDPHYKYPENDKYTKLEKYYKLKKIQNKINGS